MRFAETIESIVSSVVAPVMLVFGVTLILVASSATLQIVGIGVIVFSIIVFVLQISRQIKGLKVHQIKVLRVRVPRVPFSRQLRSRPAGSTSRGA
jgi:hypothetical protein